MNVPSLVADLLAPVAPAGNGAADVPVAAELLADALAGSGDPRGTATFAALLQSAGLAASELPADERQPGEAEAPATAVTAAEAVPSAIDTLLFLANVAVPPAAQVATTNTNVPGARADATHFTSTAAPGDATNVDAAKIVDLSTTSPTAAVAGTNATEAISNAEATPAAGFAPARGALTEALAGATNAVAASNTKRSAVANETPLLAAMFTANANAAGDAARIASPIDAPVAAASGPDNLPLPPQGALGTQTTAPAATIDIRTPVHDAGWRYEAAERIASLVTRGVERAELRLSPAELGPVEVRIDVRGGEASLAIVATQAATRDALEQALPALRDMLAQQGLSLGEASVRDGRADGQAQADRQASDNPRFDGDARTATESLATPVAMRSVSRLVDTFA